jgi:hypothetical protein
MTPEEFHAHVRAQADAEGRLPLPPMTGWEIFPFEQDGLRSVPLDPPVLPEPPRGGEAGRPCWACDREPVSEDGQTDIWADDDWRLSMLGPSGTPFVLLLEPREHLDLTSLSDDLARELGVLIVRISQQVEALPHVGRCHVTRWGDGGAHLHVFFWARPAGFQQLRGSCLPIWDDLLPPAPAAQRELDVTTVAAALVTTYGGTAHAIVPPAPPGS